MRLLSLVVNLLIITLAVARFPPNRPMAASSLDRLPTRMTKRRTRSISSLPPNRARRRIAAQLRVEGRTIMASRRGRHRGSPTSSRLAVVGGEVIMGRSTRIITEEVVASVSVCHLRPLLVNSSSISREPERYLTALNLPLRPRLKRPNSYPLSNDRRLPNWTPITRSREDHPLPPHRPRHRLKSILLRPRTSSRTNRPWLKKRSRSRTLGIRCLRQRSKAEQGVR